jgi:peptidoglycan/LPS O-acetylase OafA/YrhL
MSQHNIGGTYRPDIDGLRAVAVLSVILFHLEESVLPGGFAGVDVFFVISGYLISLNLFQGLDAGRFSIVDFYRRRVKRIAPPMLIVIAATLILCHFLFLPEDTERASESALWSLLSLANVYFWLFQDVSYFAAASNESPLLHLWSLGVEEQFYIFWPLILLLTYKANRARAMVVCMTIAAVASFVLAEGYFERDPSFVYYMLPTRAGELLVGAITALLTLNKIETRIPKAVVAPIAIVGLLMLAASLVLLSEQNVFPGILALPPTLGTAFLILAGHCGPSPVSRVLAAKPLVWVGLVSYSAYLWHWPLMAFFRYGYGDIGVLAGTGIFVITFALAWLSYRFIELPARTTNAPAIAVFLKQYIVPAGVLGVASLAAMYADGYGLRWFPGSNYRAELAAVRQQTRAAYDYEYVCQKQRPTLQDAEQARCVIGSESSEEPRALLIGDSNAAHYVGMLGVFGRTEGFRFRNLEIGACPPIQSDPQNFVVPARLADCRDFLQVFNDVTQRYDVIVISASWSDYQKRSDLFLRQLFETVSALAGQKKLVVLIGKAPVIAGYDRLCREKALSYPQMRCPLTQVAPLPEVSEINGRLRDFAQRTAGVEYFDVTDYLCPNGVCSAFDAKGEPVYYDSHHLTLAASWKLGEAIVEHSGVPKPFTLDLWKGAGSHNR